MFIFVYLLIAEVFVLLFRITGLTEEKARFQVISMLTNSGYTTKEAELVLDSRMRRKLARFVMMFGYAFTVTIVSTVVNIFLQFKSEFTIGAVAIIPMLAIFGLLIWFIKRKGITGKIADKIIAKIANKFIYDEKSNPIIIVEDYGQMTIASVKLVIMPKELEGIELAKSNLKTEHNINVLLKKNSEGDILPQADTKFEVGDTIVVMGKEKDIRGIFGLSLKNES